VKQIAVFGGGCFWCTEATFQAIKGVESALPGYTGGPAGPAPSYQQVCTGRTGHAEVVQVTFDPKVVSYEQLLNVFFATHDPTTLNRQGHDSGTQYRSAIYTTSKEQQTAAEAFIKEHANDFDDKIVTEVKPLDKFFEAEEYHHDYFKRNPYAGYCMAIISPKVSKMRKQFAHLLAE
jgi:peptide-methionine (S)-S-oxide reductase